MYLCIIRMKSLFSNSERIFCSLLKLLVYSLPTRTAMNAASALFFSHAHPIFSRLITFAGWYCIYTLLCDAVAKNHYNFINSGGRVLALCTIFHQFYYYSFVPDLRVEIAMLIGNPNPGLMLPARR